MGRSGVSSHIKVKTDIEIEIEEMRNSPASVMRHHHSPSQDTAMQDVGLESTLEDDSDEELEAGIQLNQRLVAAAAAREQPRSLPNIDMFLDPAWEAYLKEVAERGGTPYAGDLSAARQAALARLSAVGAGGATHAINSAASAPQQPHAPARS